MVSGMNNEYITKAQAIDLAESLRPIAGNAITDAFIKGIEGVEGEKDHITRDKVWTGTKLEWNRYIGQNIKDIRIVIDRTYSAEEIEAVLREVMKQLLTMTEEEKTRPLI